MFYSVIISVFPTKQNEIIRYLHILKYHPQEQLMLFPLLYLNSKSCLLQDIFGVHSVCQLHVLNTTTRMKLDKQLFSVSIGNPLQEFPKKVTSRDRLTTLFSY